MLLDALSINLSFGRFRMGGSHQSTCPPPSSSATPRSKSPATGAAGFRALAQNPIRSHEVTSRGEVDFHDDKEGVKCAVDSAAFFTAYSGWRSKMSEELTLAGNDGSGGHSSVTFLPYVDDGGDMQVAMSVRKASVGQTVLDLDILAHFS